MAIYYDNCINIFTDASTSAIETNKGKLNLACPGYVVTYRGHMTGDSNLAVYIDEDSLFGEAMGVYMAVQWACCNHSNTTPPVYNIFTDSKTVVCNVYKYLSDWLGNNRPMDELNKIANSPFMIPNSWRSICYNIALIIFKNFCPIRVFYTPGHVNLKDRNQIAKKTYTMMEINSCYHPEVVLDEFKKVINDSSTFNNVIDVYTRNWIFNNRESIIGDINDPNATLILGPNKQFPIRWQPGYSLVCIPMYQRPNVNEMLLVKPSTAEIQRPKLA